MSAEPKRVELTKAERVRILAVSAYRTKLMREVETIIAARVSAARREALLEAADLVAPLSGIGMGSCPTRSEWSEWLRDRAAALAEPERDEEGGR